MSEFDGSPVLNWWKKGSSCDAVGGQDGGTLYPGEDNDDYDDDYDDDCNVMMMMMQAPRREMISRCSSA